MTKVQRAGVGQFKGIAAEDNVLKVQDRGLLNNRRRSAHVPCHDLIRPGLNSFEERGILAVDSTFFDVFPFPVTRGDGREALRQPFQLVITELAETKR